MKHVNSIEIDYNKEELIPWFSPEFPYIAACAELGKYREREVPWHWHRMGELFYMKSGTIEYTTPAGKAVCGCSHPLRHTSGNSGPMEGDFGNQSLF